MLFHLDNQLRAILPLNLHCHDRGAIVFGICGGFQMLGATVSDPDQVEAAGITQVKGMGLLPMDTVFRGDKLSGAGPPEELRRAAKLCRERGVDLHVTCNTMPRNDEMARLPQWLELLEEAGVTAVILADEATGNLDTRTSFEVLVLFQQLHAAGRTIIFVTHNPEIAQYSSRNITLRDGRVTGDVRNAAILDAAETLAQLPEQED